MTAKALRIRTTDSAIRVTLIGNTLNRTVDIRADEFLKMFWCRVEDRAKYRDWLAHGTGSLQLCEWEIEALDD